MRRLTFERLRIGWTIHELADEAELDRRTVNAIETGRQRGSNLTLMALAQALEWPEERFAELREEMSIESDSAA